ncbi:MAG: hypothetical protein JJU11_07335 [Candidatus Sumerlaeia bacterium]|nr:hypothetical protein [Candidatus Sumerlaeia bacterium]
MYSKKAGTMIRMASVAVAVAMVPTISQANFSLGGPLSMLPNDVDFAIGLKLDPAGNENSFLHYIPREEIAEFIREKWEEDGNEVPELSQLAEAALLFTFHPDLLPKMRMFAAGAHADAAGGEPDLHFVMGGSFTADEINEVASGVGATPQTDEAPGTFTGADGSTLGHFYVPRRGILLVSKNQSWLGNATGNLQNRTGLATDGGSFSSLLPVINSRDADLFIYAPMAPLLEQAEPMLQSPEVAMFAAPLRQSRAIGIGIYPTESPTAEVTISFTDANNAQTATMMLNGFLELAKSQALMQIQMQLNDPAVAGDPEMKEQLESGMKTLQQTRLTAVGEATNLVAPIDRAGFGDPAEAREKIMEFIRMQDESGDFMGGLQGGANPNFAPPPGSGNPAW